MLNPSSYIQVVYFSATGITKCAAEKLAECTGNGTLPYGKMK